MGVLVKRGDENVLYVKGAPENVMERCTMTLLPDGSQVPLTPKLRQAPGQRLVGSLVESLFSGFVPDSSVEIPTVPRVRVVHGSSRIRTLGCDRVDRSRDSLERVDDGECCRESLRRPRRALELATVAESATGNTIFFSLSLFQTKRDSLGLDRLGHEHVEGRASHLGLCGQIGRVPGPVFALRPREEPGQGPFHRV